MPTPEGFLPPLAPDFGMTFHSAAPRSSNRLKYDGVLSSSPPVRRPANGPGGRCGGLGLAYSVAGGTLNPDHGGRPVGGRGIQGAERRRRQAKPSRPPARARGSRSEGGWGTGAGPGTVRGLLMPYSGNPSTCGEKV